MCCSLRSAGFSRSVCGDGVVIYACLGGGPEIVLCVFLTLIYNSISLPLVDLTMGMVEMVKALQEKIKNPSKISNEMTTRYSLIDPLLRGLGWDTEDPNVVVSEYSSGAGRADYALFNDMGKPAIIIEAKKLGDPLEGAADQGINYCVREGIEYFAVTDGNKWRVYETHKPAPIPDKLIQSFDVGDMEPAEVCIKMLTLWRRHIGVLGIAVSRPSNRPAPGRSTLGTETPHQSSWKPITDLVYAVGDSPPIGLRFPDGSTTSIVSWVDILDKTATWLIENNHITKNDCPISAGKSQFIVATKPMHSGKKRFSTKQRIHDLYLERNFSPKQVLRHSATLVKHAGLDIRNFEFEL